ncbi:MAG: hypothetical protein RMJ17_01395 [Candidatus Aenigmarchaeota archaeon]|nr:hypothetical protein [Candidatus Aenigmarchaeota archaeon]MDW8149235.1 hypothetical protein [Candidatus Aenigmarchaeota archaeon]
MKSWIVFFLVLFVVLSIYFSLIIFQNHMYRSNLIVFENLKKVFMIESVYKSMKASLHLSTIRAWNDSDFNYYRLRSNQYEDFKNKLQIYLNDYVVKLSEKSRIKLSGLPVKVDKINKEKNNDICISTSSLEINIENPTITKKFNLNACIEEKYFVYKDIFYKVLDLIDYEMKNICTLYLRYTYTGLSCRDTCPHSNAKTMIERAMREKIKEIAKLNSNKNSFVEVKDMFVDVRVTFYEKYYYRTSCYTTPEGEEVCYRYCSSKDCVISSISSSLRFVATSSARGIPLMLFITKGIENNYNC